MLISTSHKFAWEYRLPNVYKTCALFSTTIKPNQKANPVLCAQTQIAVSRARLYDSLVMAKRKSQSQSQSLSTATQGAAITTVPIHRPTFDDDAAPPPKRSASQRRISQQNPAIGSTNPDKNANVLDAPEALRASPDADETMNLEAAGMDVEKQVKEEDSDSPLSNLQDVEEPVEQKKAKGKVKGKDAIAATAKKEDKEASKKPAVVSKDNKQANK